MEMKTTQSAQASSLVGISQILIITVHLLAHTLTLSSPLPTIILRRVLLCLASSISFHTVALDPPSLPISSYVKHQMELPVC